MQSIEQQGENMLAQMNAALANQSPQVVGIVNAKTDDKDAMGKRMMALLNGADSMSGVLQQAAVVGLGTIALASTTIPGDLRVVTEEIGAGIERHFTFYRGDFRIGTIILGQSGKESGKVGGSVTILIDEATLTWPAAPSFSSN